jgi:capsular exopolysaccharide synthesis family protein
MGLHDVSTALRRSWWLPVLGVLLGAAAGLAVVLLSTPQYTSHTRLFVSTTESGSTADVFQGSQFSQQRVASYAELLEGEELAGRVIDRLDLRETPEDLSEEIAATAVPDTVLLDVTVSDASATRAQEIADAVGSEFTDMVTALETPNGGTVSPVRISVVERADRPTVPAEPRPVRDLLTGLALGLAVGCGAAVARARLDRSVRDPEEIAALAGAPVLGTVVRDEVLAERHVFERHAESRIAEDFRRIRTNLQFVSIDEPPRVIMISSGLPAEGKTTLTVNLGVALAESGHRVTIVEADLRRPRVTRYLGLVGGVGLTNVLAGSADLDEVVQDYRQSGLFVLGAGPKPPNPGELLASGHMAALLDKVRGMNDFVLIDAPPLLPVADSTGLAPLVDGVLVAVHHGRTTKDQLRQTVATMEKVRSRVLGVVVNVVPPRADTAAGYGYGYAADASKHRP